MHKSSSKFRILSLFNTLPEAITAMNIICLQVDAQDRRENKNIAALVGVKMSTQAKRPFVQGFGLGNLEGCPFRGAA